MSDNVAKAALLDAIEQRKAAQANSARRRVPCPTCGRMPLRFTAGEDANHSRQLRAAKETVRQVRRILATRGDIPDRLTLAGRLRIQHPKASLTELGQIAGTSKDTIAGLLRRLLALGEAVAE
jgi:DNA-binding transcriptional regulator WhiA